MLHAKGDRIFGPKTKMSTLMKWRNSLFAGSIVVNLILLVAVICAVVKCGHSPPLEAEPDAKPNAGPCFVSLSKMDGGNVRLSLLEVNGDSLVIQRRGEDFGGLIVEVRDIHGNWSPLDRIDSGEEIDPADAEKNDWVSMMNGDEVSWDLRYLPTGRLRVGDRVRLTWKTIGRVPPPFTGLGKPFPKVAIHLELTVGKGRP